MPKYYNVENWSGIKKAIIEPVPWYRRVWIIKNILPYHVGDSIKFKLKKLELESNPKHNYTYVIMEQIGDKLVIKSDALPDVIFTGTKIPIEQSVSYFIGRSLIGNVTGKELVFTTTVQSWDTVFSKWGWAIVGAIFSLLVGVIFWLLGFIELVPAWKVWVVP